MVSFFCQDADKMQMLVLAAATSRKVKEECVAQKKSCIIVYQWQFCGLKHNSGLLTRPCVSGGPTEMNAASVLQQNISFLLSWSDC